MHRLLCHPLTVTGENVTLCTPGFTLIPGSARSVRRRIWPMDNQCFSRLQTVRRCMGLFQIVLTAEACFVTYNMIDPRGGSMYSWEKMYIQCPWMQRFVIPIMSICSVVCVQSVASLLSFCLIDLYVDVNGVLR